MVKMNYSFELSCDKDKFFHVLTDYQNLVEYMPRQLQKIEILEKQDKHTIIELTIFLRNLIKKQFSQRLKIHVESENKILLEILDGIAKGTQSTISIISDDEKTVCNINTNVKLSLKAAILYPVIKKEYVGFLTKVSRNIMGNINE
jgi:hypothetical protein